MAHHLNFVGTFGIGQARAGKYVLFTATDPGDANERMRAVYGENWSMAREITPDDPDPAGIEQWGLIEIEFGT